MKTLFLSIVTIVGLVVLGGLGWLAFSRADVEQKPFEQEIQPTPLAPATPIANVPAAAPAPAPLAEPIPVPEIAPEVAPETAVEAPVAVPAEETPTATEAPTE